eukprot:GAHX01001275.1.p1 GENE.GAHX01001275.1~~GAHX01001275.1.p1  ORF type:complete len:1632 (-),score=368.94 GAHX01001275.1:26-4879(-)
MVKKRQPKAAKASKTGVKRAKVINSTATYVVEMVSDALEISASKIRPRVTHIINKAVTDKVLNTVQVAKEVAFEIYQYISLRLETPDNIHAMMTRSRRTLKLTQSRNYFSSLLQMYTKLHNTKESIFFKNLTLMLLNLVPYNKINQFCSFLIIHKDDEDVEDFLEFLNFIINTTSFEYNSLLVKYFKFIFQTAKEYYFSDKNMPKLHNLQTFFFLININPSLTLHILNYSVRLLVYCAPTVNKICATFIGELILSSLYILSSATSEQTFKNKEYITETISYINNTINFLEMLKKHYYPVFIIFLKQFASVVRGNENPDIHPIIFAITSLLSNLFNKEVDQIDSSALQTQNVKEKIVEGNFTKLLRSNHRINNSFPMSCGSYFDRTFEPLNRQHCSTIREKCKEDDFVKALDNEYKTEEKKYEETHNKIQFLRINRKHVDTICNFCSCRIKAMFRYRCISCVNYDLCENCFEYLHNGKEFVLNPSQPIYKPPTENSFLCPYCGDNIKWENLSVSVSTHFYNHINACMNNFDEDVISEERFECPVCLYEQIYEENESGWFTPKLVQRHFQKYHSVSLEGTPEFHRVVLVRVPSFQKVLNKGGLIIVDGKITKYTTQRNKVNFETSHKCSICECDIKDKFYKCLNCDDVVLLCSSCATKKPHGINVVDFENETLKVHNPLHLLVYIEFKEPQKKSCNEFVRYNSRSIPFSRHRHRYVPFGIPYDPSIPAYSPTEEVYSSVIAGNDDNQSINNGGDFFYDNSNEEEDDDDAFVKRTPPLPTPRLPEEVTTPEQLAAFLKDITSSVSLYREEMGKTSDILTSSALLFNQITSLIISTYIGYTYPLLDSVNNKYPVALRNFVESKTVQFFDIILSQVTFLNSQFDVIKQQKLKINTEQVTNREVFNFVSSVNQNWCFGICEILCNFHNYAPFALKTQKHNNFTYELLKESIVMSVYILSNAGHYINNPHFVKEMLKCISTFEFSPQINNLETLFTENLLQLSDDKNDNGNTKQLSDIYDISGDSRELTTPKKTKERKSTLSADDLYAVKLENSVQLKIKLLKHPIIKNYFFDAYIKATNYYMEKHPVFDDEDFDPIYKRISLFISPLYLLSIIHLQNIYDSATNNEGKVIDDYKYLFDLIRHKDDIYAQNISITNPPFCFTEYKTFTLISKNESFRTLVDYKLISNYLLKSAHKQSANEMKIDTDAETFLLNPDGKLTPRKEFEIMRYLNYSREVLNIAFKHFKDKLKKHHEEIYNKLPLGKEREEVKHRVNILYPQGNDHDQEPGVIAGDTINGQNDDIRADFRDQLGHYLATSTSSSGTHVGISEDDLLQLNRDDDQYSDLSDTLRTIVPPDRLRQAARCFCNILSMLNPLIYLLGNFKPISELFCNQEISIYYINTINGFLKKIFEENNIKIWVQIYDYVQANGFHKIEHYLINLPLVVFSILKMIYLFIKKSTDSMKEKFRQELDLELIDNAVTFVSEYKFYMNGDNVYSSKNVEEFEKYMNEEECNMLLYLSSVVMGEIVEKSKEDKENDEIKEAKEQVEKEDKNIPREMLDCITLEALEVPIMIKGQRVNCDKSTIIKHMLTNKTNPFTGLEMDIDDITVDEELYQKIQDLKNKKNK